MYWAPTKNNAIAKNEGKETGEAVTYENETRKQSNHRENETKLKQLAANQKSRPWVDKQYTKVNEIQPKDYLMKSSFAAMQTISLFLCDSQVFNVKFWIENFWHHDNIRRTKWSMRIVGSNRPVVSAARNTWNKKNDRIKARWRQSGNYIISVLLNISETFAFVDNKNLIILVR